MAEPLITRLTPDDDPALWQAVVDVLTAETLRRRELEPSAKLNWFLQIGACSHWLRPHQTRWTAAGGFAYPVGYQAAAGHSRGALPEFDWSLTFRLFNSEWVAVEKFAGRNQRTVRVAVPSRTTRHKQAAIHTLWMPSRETIFYGFRNRAEGWQCVAASDEKKNGRVKVR
jgi:hypothetical protein